MKLVIALGGNALGSTPKEQLALVEQTARAIVDLSNQGHQILIGHGNGPQVGMVTLAFDHPNVPDMPFAECGAMSQGYIGYHLQQSIRNRLLQANKKQEVVTVVTQVEVDKNDKAFACPTKPIGSFYSQEQANRISQEKRFAFVEDSGRGYRRVVPSPQPINIIEKKSIETLSASGAIVITVGGGGIPVVKTESGYRGIDAVIDKDFASSLLARQLGADMLIILTSVAHVSLRYGQPDQKELTELCAAQAGEYIKSGEFAKGSMLPKVQACVAFAKTGKTAVITSLDQAHQALLGNIGTRITG